MLVMFYNFFYKYLLVYIKMTEITDLTYYKKNWNVILNKAKDYYKNNKERLKEQTRDKYRSLSEEIKIKREIMGRIGIIICLKKRNRDLKNIKNIFTGQKSLNITINKIIFCSLLSIKND